MRIIKLILIIALTFFINCDSTTKPEDIECSLITDYINLSYDCDYLDTLRVLDIDFSYIYHFEGNGGQLIRYFYFFKDIRTESGYGSGWVMSNDRKPPMSIPSHYIDCNSLDTLRYSHLFDISKQDTFYKEFRFTLKGFFSDSGFFNVKDTLNKKSFEYVYIDTILIIK